MMTKQETIANNLSYLGVALNANDSFNIIKSQAVDFTKNNIFDFKKEEGLAIIQKLQQEKLAIEKSFISDIENAKSLNQSALLNSLKAELKAKTDSQAKQITQIQDDLKAIEKLEEIASKGYTTIITLKLVLAFQKLTPACFFDKLKDFSRPIYEAGSLENCPIEDVEQYNQLKRRKEAFELVKKAKDSKCFDEIMILNLDYPRYEREQEEKMKAKDPIAFGVVTELPNHLFFIADWIDEKCDLTLSKIMETKIV